MLLHIVQNNWSKKKLNGALFIDVKRAFDYPSKCQLFMHMIELIINTYLVA